MADAKDILGLRQDGPPKGKAKLIKEPAQRKPEGVSREVRAPLSTCYQQPPATRSTCFVPLPTNMCHCNMIMIASLRLAKHKRKVIIKGAAKCPSEK